MLSGAVLYVKSGGRVTGVLDVRKALEQSGYVFGDDGNDEIQVTLGDVTDEVTTNASVRLFVAGSAAGTAIAGAERTDEDAVESNLFGAVDR